MLIPNRNMSSAIVVAALTPFIGTNTVDFMTFCKGPALTDAQVAGLTAVSNALIQNAKVGVIANSAGLAMGASSNTAVPPVLLASTLPATKTFTVSGVGSTPVTITHAVVKSTYGGTTQFCVVDVGLLNSGAVVQVDNTSVVDGSVVTLQSIQFKIWRS